MLRREEEERKRRRGRRKRDGTSISDRTRVEESNGKEEKGKKR